MTAKDGLAWTLSCIGSVGAAQALSGDRFQIDDYFQLRRIVEIALTATGDRVAYVVETRSPAAETPSRAVYVRPVNETAAPAEIDVLAGSQGLAWISNGRKLAFISPENGVSQIFSYDTVSGERKELTRSAAPVTMFRASPADASIAYLTAARGGSLFEEMRSAGPGIVIDTDKRGYMDFVDPGRAAVTGAEAPQLWVLPATGQASRIEVPGEVKDFAWSSDGGSLSITYVGADAPDSMFKTNCTSIGILDIRSRQFRPFAEAVVDTARRNCTSLYFGGAWVPGLSRIVVARATDINPWVGDLPFPSIAILDTETPFDAVQVPWTPVDLYPRISRLIPVNATTVHAQTRLRARDMLLRIQADRIGAAEMTGGLGGGSRLFEFNRDFSTSVFVNESLERPPELYLWRKGSKPRQLTALNTELASRTLPRASEITWRSTDGSQVAGWLLLPPQENRQAHPLPLLTFVHGGPGFAYPNQFAPYYDIWPYPFEVLALDGIAVFIPQYRGTLSFGRRTAHPARTDLEPIQDIESGLRFLMAKGIADEKKLAICGHSHGGWLGPMTAVRTRMFIAGSFAEGWSSQITLYELNAASLNREVHETGTGEPALYDRPQRYLELSPDLHFDGLTFAALFESGSEAVAMQMLGMAKAARRFGLPSELIIYPRTGHGIQSPRLQKEASERNRDWMRYWLLNEEDPDTAKAGQYGRWRVMREKRGS